MIWMKTASLLTTVLSFSSPLHSWLEPVRMEWSATYDGPASMFDTAVSMKLDGNGNVYVTGYSAGNGSSLDFITIKYDASGDELWTARYDGPARGEDRAFAITLDDSDNVFVTGSSEGAGTGTDYATIKYSTDGSELWVNRYDGPVSGEDHAWSIEVDEKGNSYVTGGSDGEGTGRDCVTMKYSP